MKIKQFPALSHILIAVFRMIGVLIACSIFSSKVQAFAVPYLSNATPYAGLKPLAQNLDTICTNPAVAGDMLAVCNALNGLSDSDANAAIHSIAFDVSGSSTLASLSNNSEILSSITHHLDTLRLAGMNSPHMAYVAGDKLNGTWGLRPILFGNMERQKEEQTIEGFRAESRGLGLLLDQQWHDNFIVGLGATYSTTDVRTLVFNNTTQIRSFQGVFYAVYDYCQFFADGIVSLGQNHYRNQHNIIITDRLTRNAFSKHYGFQTTAKVRAGYNIPIYESELTPTLSLFETNLRQNAFVEDNAVSLNQSVERREDILVQGGAGFKWTYTGHRDCFLPDIHAFYLRNLRNPNLQVTSTLLGGGAAFTTTSPHLPRDSYNVGLGLSAALEENISIGLGYDVEIRRKYLNNSGSVRLRWAF